MRETDKAEFERLYAECFSAVQRYCYFKLPGKADGDDVLQEVALSAWKYRESVRDAASFKPWILRIAANKCADFYRKRAKQLDVPLEEFTEFSFTQSRYGITIQETVWDALDALGERDRSILAMFYLRNLPQAEIARRLNVPLGTVKSRLHTARERFRLAYPESLKIKGDLKMKKLPDILPAYTITPTDKPLFSVEWEEIMGWFFIPKLGEKRSWAIYDQPSGERKEQYDTESVGRAVVHGIEGVEVVTRETLADGTRGTDRTFVAQLTDTHSRILSESHVSGGVKHFYTFLDGDDFLSNWGFGEDNCGNSIHPVAKSSITNFDNIPAFSDATEKFVLTFKGQHYSPVVAVDVKDGGGKLPQMLIVVGRFNVTLGGKTYDTICVVDVESYDGAVLTETYLDANGCTVLWRRFNRNDWHIDRYGKPWSEQLPDNERLTINDATYVHWYDCITDYIG